MSPIIIIVFNVIHNFIRSVEINKNPYSITGTYPYYTSNSTVDEVNKITSNYGIYMKKMELQTLLFSIF